MVADNAGYNGPAHLGAADNGFFLAGDDGAFRLTAGGYLQKRYVYKYRQKYDSGAGGTDAGFTTPRARLWLGGEASDKWSYFARGDFRGVASQSGRRNRSELRYRGWSFPDRANYGDSSPDFTMALPRRPHSLNRVDIRHATCSGTVSRGAERPRSA